jgi:hypothetical protein
MTEAPLIRHKRWRHKTRGYEVNVLDTRTAGCPTVTVDRTQYTQAQRTWNIEKFLLEFEPLGKPIRLKTLWDLL